MEPAWKKGFTDEIWEVSRGEGVAAEKLLRGMAKGRIVMLRNSDHEIQPVAVGEGVRVKVNANIGMSPDIADEKSEMEKARVAVRYGADTLMDLSIAGDSLRLLKRLLKLRVPIGTVPIYQAALDSVRRHGTALDMDADAPLQVIERHVKAGVDFMTVHAGITMETLEVADKVERVTGIVSRGGSLLARWMRSTGMENPLYSEFDYILELVREREVVLSLGDALRPGCIADASDRAQMEELILLSRLVERSWEQGVEVMVEGPGHLPLNEIPANIMMAKKLCRGAPFYVLGPIVTDVAAGYDHIAGAIGGAVAALHGADFLCYVTPSEHLALPDTEDVKQGVIAAKIAAHAANIARGLDLEKDLSVARARARLDWEEQFKHLLDPAEAAKVRRQRHPADPRVCTMCGEFCSMRR